MEVGPHIQTFIWPSVNANTSHHVSGWTSGGIIDACCGLDNKVAAATTSRYDLDALCERHHLTQRIFTTTATVYSGNSHVNLA